MIGPTYLDVVQERTDKLWRIAAGCRRARDSYKADGNRAGELAMWEQANIAGNRAIEWQRVQYFLTGYYGITRRDREARERIYQG